MSLSFAGFGKKVGEADYHADIDPDRDGEITVADYFALLGQIPADISAMPPAGPGKLSRNTAAGPDNTLGFAGYQFCHTTGLYAVRFRHYDPDTGRWLQRDPAGYVDGLNLYQYVGSNPNKYIDPWGLDKLVYDGNKICRVSDDLKECIKCWKGRSGTPLRDKDGKIERDSEGMPKFPEPTVDQQRIQDVGPIPEGDWKVPCKRESKKPGNKGYWKRTDWNDYEDNRWAFQTRVNKRNAGPWGEWFVRCEPGLGCETYGRSNFNIHGGRFEDGGEWGSAGCIDLMCQDDDFFADLGRMCGAGTHIDMIVDYSGKSMPAGCNEPGDPCKAKENPENPGNPG